MAIKTNGATISGNGRHGINVGADTDVDASGSKIFENGRDGIHVRAAPGTPPKPLDHKPWYHHVLAWLLRHLAKIVVGLIVGGILLVFAWYFGLNGNRI